jgi:hypothetical protein
MYNSLALDDKKDVSQEVRILSALRKWSGVELCPTMHMGYVNFEVKHLVSLHFYNTHNFCIESSNDIKFVRGERLFDL